VIDCKNATKTWFSGPRFLRAKSTRMSEPERVSPATGESGTGESIREWVSPAIGESTTNGE
jgi:hypothetical protein